jgi:hypothetical protein
VVVGASSFSFNGRNDQGAAYVFGQSQAVPVVVTGIAPSSGPTAGGIPVTITGSGFTSATAVDFGTVAATNVVVNSAGTQITATSPAGTAGTVDVTVTTPGGSSASSSADKFTSVVTIGSEILDNSQPGFWSSSASTWTTSAQGLGGGSLLSSTANGSKQSQAAWWFSMPAGVYEIDMTWPASGNLTTKLGLDLYDGVGNWIGQFTVNEQVAPSDFSDQGAEWKRVGSIRLTNNVFRISTWNSATDGAIAIDAMRLRAVPTVDAGDAQIKGKGGALAGSYFTTTGSWTTSTHGAFGSSQTSSSTAGSGTSTATWAMPVTPGSYEVDVTWAAASTLSANVTYNVYDGATKLGSITVDQQTAPSDFADDGIGWKGLGNFTVSGNLLTVTVANSASDGQVSAGAIRILPANQPAEIVGTCTPGSWSTATGWTTINQGLFGGAMVSNTANGSKQSQAAWWFACQPGQYEVDVTWQPGSNYSQSVGFDVYNALSWIKTATVDEQNAPIGTTDQGVTWQSLGVFTMTSNVLHLSTWNSPADGAICVDGVRIVPVGTSAASDEPATGAALAMDLEAICKVSSLSGRGLG